MSSQPAGPPPIVLEPGQPIQLDLVPPPAVELTLTPPADIVLDLVAPPAIVVDLVPPAPIEVTLNPVGQPGPAGPPGPDRHAAFVQAEPAAEWIWHHGLGRRTMPTLFTDDDPGEPVWTDVTFTDDDTLTISWPTPCTGTAYL